MLGIGHRACTHSRSSILCAREGSLARLPHLPSVRHRVIQWFRVMSRRFTLAKSHPDTNSNSLQGPKAKQALQPLPQQAPVRGIKQHSGTLLAGSVCRTATPCPGLSAWCSRMVSAAYQAPPARPCSKAPGLIRGGLPPTRTAGGREAKTLCSPLSPSVRPSRTLKDSSATTCHLTALLPATAPSFSAGKATLAGWQAE